MNKVFQKQPLPEPLPRVFREVVNWRDLHFYQKAEVLYQMTVFFCRRFLFLGDRTIDQMTQAARSGKQNIAEGTEAGKSSTETELKLLNVARASLVELRLDYQDYLQSHHLSQWCFGNERLQKLHKYGLSHNALSDYEPYFSKWTAEEFCNVGITLCFQVDTMMNRYMAYREKLFVTEGGIRERMYTARTGYRSATKQQVLALEQELAEVRKQLAQAQDTIAQLKQELGNR